MASSSWVLITGANRATGLGYKTAKQLVNDGEHVIIGARTQASADEAAARLGKETGHPERVAGLTVDISDSKSIEAAAQTLERDYAGKLGGLINNAAVNTPEITEGEYHRLWGTNVKGTFELSQRLVPLINEGGHIAHVASTLGQLENIAIEGPKLYIGSAKSVQALVDMPYPADELSTVPEPRTDMGVLYLLYNMSKAAVLHGTRMQAADPALTSRGITVVAECPGWCRTDMGSDKAPRPAEDGAKAIAWAYLSPTARSSNGSFFQDNRALDIIEVDPTCYGPANWIEE